MPFALLSHEDDNIATALEPISKGDSVIFSEGLSVTALQDIPMYHKIAVADVPEGGIIFKYGNRMGVATSPILKGGYVHVHNISSLRARRGA